MKFGVIVFPGSNCDHDMLHVLGEVMGVEVREIWHKEDSFEGFTEEDGIILPGGFSYGDYLRSGAIASHSPIMKSVVEFANKGGFVLGICNGFQILCESGLLPGALLRNNHQKFSCKNIHLKTMTTSSSVSNKLEQDEVVKIPIAHAEGRYFADEATIKSLEKNNQIIFKYSDENGIANDSTNPNGSVKNIAGICNKNRNVFGMMPHPERAAEGILGNTDGKKIFESILAYAKVTL